MCIEYRFTFDLVVVKKPFKPFQSNWCREDEEKNAKESNSYVGFSAYFFVVVFIYRFIQCVCVCMWYWWHLLKPLDLSFLYFPSGFRSVAFRFCLFFSVFLLYFCVFLCLYLWRLCLFTFVRMNCYATIDFWRNKPTFITMHLQWITGVLFQYVAQTAETVGWIKQEYMEDWNDEIVERTKMWLSYVLFRRVWG